MEIAEIIALAFVAAGTLSYGTTRQWRNNHRNHLKDTTSSLEEEGYLVSLTFDPPAGLIEGMGGGGIGISGGIGIGGKGTGGAGKGTGSAALRIGAESLHVALLAFNQQGDLVRKVPQAEFDANRRGRCKVKCRLTREVETVCVLVSATPFGIGGLDTYYRAVRHRQPGVHLWWGEGEVMPANLLGMSAARQTPLRRTKLHLELEEMMEGDGGGAGIGSAGIGGDIGIGIGGGIGSAGIGSAGSGSTGIGTEMNTDAMAKCLQIATLDPRQPWHTRIVEQDEPHEPWISLPTPHSATIVLQLKANFTGMERKAMIEVQAEDGGIGTGTGIGTGIGGGGITHRFAVSQRAMSQQPHGLEVSRRLYVCDGSRRETLALSVTPETDATPWQVKTVATSDGRRWWSIDPRPGQPMTGRHTLRMELEPKPANVHSRTAVVTLETGTYPFNRTVEVSVMQGLRFDYYIEYPKNDPCARHAQAIETPLSYKPGDEVKVYTVRVDSNQPWRIVRDEAVKWIEVEQHPCGGGDLYSARFVVRVAANGEGMHRGMPAARSTVLSLVTDTGTVRDILVYQGGYVRIKGMRWLDRNLSGKGELTAVAIPLGLEEGSRSTWGSYFQFGSAHGKWLDAPTACPHHWYEGTAENPTRREELDPCPPGWRVPSRLEMEGLVNRSSGAGVAEEEHSNLCLLSDDGVPVYLPLCGHRSHINGCIISIAHSHRYWTGSSQSPAYGYSLCVEPSQQLFVMHEMKKFGFPVRGVEG